MKATNGLLWEWLSWSNPGPQCGRWNDENRVDLTMLVLVNYNLLVSNALSYDPCLRWGMMAEREVGNPRRASQQLKEHSCWWPHSDPCRWRWEEQGQWKSCRSKSERISCYAGLWEGMPIRRPGFWLQHIPVMYPRVTLKSKSLSFLFVK